MTGKNTAESPTSASAANASRLRENQRRSRARKKEYLMSLETRFLACQRTGIEANIEIQNAAKRVVRENQLLRELLRRRGVLGPEVDKFVKDGGEGGCNGETAVEGVLKALVKRPCGGGDSSFKPEPVERERKAAAGERRNSTGMIAARDAGLGIRKPTILTSTPVLEASPHPSPQLTSPSSSAHYSPSVPTTPTAATSLAAFSIPPPALAPVPNFYNFTSNPLPTSSVPFATLAESLSNGNHNSPASAPGPTSHPSDRSYGAVYPISTQVTSGCNTSSYGAVCSPVINGCSSASCSPTISSCGRAPSPCGASNQAYSYNYAPFPQSGYTQNTCGNSCVSAASCDAANSLYPQYTFGDSYLPEENYSPGDMSGNAEADDCEDNVMLFGVLDRI
ncbi:hypothetical protein RUND412_003616 [Rhizina undulata]